MGGAKWGGLEKKKEFQSNFNCKVKKIKQNPYTV